MKRLVQASMILATMAILFTSCNCYNKMTKKASTIGVVATPNAMVLKGTNVVTDIKVTFPAKYFDAVAVLKITPVLVYDGGEIAGAPKFVQGQNVRDNYTVIPYKTGGSYTQSLSFPYDAKKSSNSKLELRIESKCSNNCSDKRSEFAPMSTVVVAQGISMVQSNFNYAYGSLVGGNTTAFDLLKDNYKRVGNITKDAEILYLINKADVRKEQLTTEQIKMFESFVHEYATAEKSKMSSIYAKGYSSPDGPTKLNDELSKKRSETGKNALSAQLKHDQVKYDIASYGEDWDGFKKLVEASNIKDKDLILQVLQMYSSPMQRDQEIRNMSSVFKTLAEDILPQLRRTQFTATVEVEGKTDAQLISLMEKGDLSDVNVEEALFATTLLKSHESMAKSYKAIASKYNDARAYNNLGVALATLGKFDESKTALQKAASITSSPEISTNMGIVALAQGDVATAQKYLASSTPKAKGMLAFGQGNYSESAKTLQGYNLAVAEVCNGNLAKAKTALGSDKSAQAEYLRGVIAMREGDSKAAVANLKSSISKDASFKAKASGDAEFAKLFGTTEFVAL